VDVGILRQNFRERRQQDFGGGIFRRRQANRSGRLLTKLAERSEISVHLVELGADAEE
jgi:hypothetical protein